LLLHLWSSRLQCRQGLYLCCASSISVVNVFENYFLVDSALSTLLQVHSILAENASDPPFEIDAGAVYEIAYKVQQRNAAEAQDAKKNLESQITVEQR
jgi:hypothetical protein